MLNALFLGIETELNPQGDSPSPVWAIMNQGFCIIFVIELAFRLYAYRLSYFATPANLLDFVLVLTSVLDVCARGSGLHR